jgi:hypothetical protein
MKMNPCLFTFYEIISYFLPPRMYFTSRKRLTYLPTCPPKDITNSVFTHNLFYFMDSRKLKF